MTSLMKYSPTIDSLRREVDRLFDDVLGNGATGRLEPAVWAPRTDLSETTDEYVIRMDLPGLTKKELDIELSDNVLTVTGERKSDHEANNETFHRLERAYGRFFRSFTLPNASDTERVRARMKDGVLVVEVPKREES